MVNYTYQPFSQLDMTGDLMVLLKIAWVVTAVLAAGLLVVLVRKDKLESRRLLKYLASFLLLVYVLRLYVHDAIDDTFNLFTIDIVTDRDAFETWLFPVGRSFFLIVLRWLSVTLFVWLAVGSFFKHRLTLLLGGTLGVLVSLSNIVLYDTHLVAFLGEEVVSWTSYRGLQFAIESVLFLTVSLFALYVLLHEGMKVFTWRQVALGSVAFLATMLAVMPQALLYNLFGNYGETPIDFNGIHLVIIAMPFVFTIVFFFIFRKQPHAIKEMALVVMVVAAVLQYFYVPRSGVSGLPLHLCNMAVILMFIAFVFRKEQFFYFTYFANVIGALAAILLPNYDGDLNSLGVMHFGYNHFYAFVIPILAVALKVFPRPQLKHMYQAIAVFTVYFIAVVFLNAWFRNYHSSVDYFFTYSDHLTDLFGARRVQYDYQLTFAWRDLSFTFFPLFQVIYYIAFIFLMFMGWYVYDTFYVAFDRQHALAQRQRELRLSRASLKQALAGRRFDEPVNLGGQNMISIRNFSKTYGRAAIKAVDNFSLEVKQGEVFGFLGHNGAGKSTTIKCLVGIQSITEGEIDVCGYSIKTQALYAKRHMGYVSDNHAMYEKLTGREYVNYVADLYEVDEETRQERLHYYLERLSLKHAIDHEIKSYSHGMKQKLAVIASLIHDPRVWILDEPLTGLDPTSAYLIKETMREHANRGNIVFFSSHVIEVVEKICDRIAIINRGQLEGIYELDTLRKDNIALEDLYMHNKKDLQ
ncbi:MAG: ATP-binding cassette domain-containing protein [Acholeplasmatales bacterium]|nr:MAG: ATP-binding cassette domain-containing protein [Acholeplasmatales bacterium]